MKSAIFRGLTMLALSAMLVAAAAATAKAAALQRLSAEFQNRAPGSVGGEVSTIVTPSTVTPPGGVVVYDKIISLPQAVTYITFSAQGDTHEMLEPMTFAPIPGTGSALLMSASIVDSAGTETVCQPMANAGGAAATGAPWMTLLKLPDGETVPNNCNDGGGGPADCHDNAFSFSCCVLTNPDSSGTTHHVLIRMASSNGGQVFYEDSTILIDSGPNPGGGFCSAVGTGTH